MSKKKGMGNDLIGRLANECELQGERLKRVISVFYPDGERVQFIKASQVGKVMEGSPSLHQFKEDEPMRAKCIALCESAKKAASQVTEVDIYEASQWLDGRVYAFDYKPCDAYIMLKTTPEDAPVYLQYEYISEGSNPRFLVDMSTKEAILIIEDVENNDDVKEDLKDFKKFNASYATLSELHIILVGDEDNTLKGLMTSFSKADGRFYVEQIFTTNMALLDGLLASSSPDSCTTTADTEAQENK